MNGTRSFASSTLAEPCTNNLFIEFVRLVSLDIRMVLGIKCAKLLVTRSVRKTDGLKCQTGE